MAKTVELAMIVRNEAETLPLTIPSMLPLIDGATIIDTGSTDDTEDVLQELLNGMPLTLHWSEWVNFKHNRTELMKLARGRADYLLCLDADMVVKQGKIPLPDLTLDEYQVRILGSLDYALPMILKGDRHWAFEGAAHSYLVAADGLPVSSATLDVDCLAIEDHSHTTPEKLLRDIELLATDLARDPNNARTVFYLAQTYQDLDMIPEAINYYRMRAGMVGFAEETYLAKHRLGCLLVDNISFAQGSKELLAAWEFRPSRAEALRALANSANSVADKIPYPDDVLFVRRGAYAQPEVEPEKPKPKKRKKLTPKDVSAVLVTRGNVDMEPILETLPYDDIVIWDNSVRQDMKTFGRYLAVFEAKNDIIYFQDDDVIFTKHRELLKEYRPRIMVGNMDQPWIEACGYQDVMMMGAGSICDRMVPWDAIHRYLAVHPFDAEFLIESDFVVGVLVPGHKIDIGYDTREFTDDADRLYTQPWQPAKKAKVMDQARAIRDA